jgi:hypothetical protein
VQHRLALFPTAGEITGLAVLFDGCHVARYRPPTPDLTRIVSTSTS